VKLYAKDWSNGDPNANAGIPLVLTPTRAITEADKVARAKVAAVYGQIIADLVDAEVLEGVYSVCDFSPDVADETMAAIIKKCQEKNGYVPNVMYMACHSTLYTVCWAIEQAKSTKPEDIKAALMKLDGKQVKTGEGAMTFMPNQVLTKLSLVIQYDNAKKLKTVKQLG